MNLKTAKGARPYCASDQKNAIRVTAAETPGVQAVNDHLPVYS
jgi:hypothetical protein